MKYHEKLKIIFRKSLGVRYKKIRNLNTFYRAKNWIILTTSPNLDSTYNIFTNIYERDFAEVVPLLAKKTKVLLLGERRNCIKWYKELIKRGYAAYVCLL